MANVGMMSRETLKTTAEKLRALCPEITPVEAGFQAAMALVTGYCAEVLEDPENLCPTGLALMVQTLMFVLESGQAVSGPAFKRLDRQMRNAKDN